MKDPEPFVRYYLKNITIALLRKLQGEVEELSDWHVLDPSVFSYENSYGYEPWSTKDDDTQLRKMKTRVSCALLETHTIVEHHNPSVVGGSLLWNFPDRVSTVLCDILTLCSLARNEYMHKVLIEWSVDDTNKGFSTDASKLTQGRASILEIKQLGDFVRCGLAKLNQPEWVQGTGFTPAIHWYIHALRSFLSAPPAVPLTLFWLALDILAVANASKNGQKDKNRVKQYLAEELGFNQGSPVFLDKEIDDWWDTRCYAVHPQKKLKLPEKVRNCRFEQIRDFAIFLLVNVLQPQTPQVKEGFVSQLQSYD